MSSNQTDHPEDHSPPEANMADRWFYAHDKVKSGPFSGQQLRDIADAGHIVPTDTIWKEGVEKGMLARKVKNLFPLAPADAAPPPLPEVQSNPVEPEVENKVEEIKPEQTATSVSPEPEPLSDNVQLQPLWEAPATPAKQTHVRKGRAVAGKGAVICGQDGTNVKYMKVCT